MNSNKTIIILNSNKFELIGKISAGRSSEIFLVKTKNGEKLVLKKEKQKSTRIKMVLKEVTNLKKANSLKIGPKLIDYNEEEKWVLMKYINGVSLNEFIEKKPNPNQLIRVIKKLFEQAKKMDDDNLDHGQLAGRGTNILIKKNLEPVIIDFEKASQKRKTHNLNVLKAMFFYNKHGVICEKTRKILNEKEIKKLIKIN